MYSLELDILTYFQALQTYDAFIKEAGLAEDAGTSGPGDLTLEVLLEEKKRFDLSAQFEKTGISDENLSHWTTLGISSTSLDAIRLKANIVPAPKTCHELTSLAPARANVLSAIVVDYVDNG